MTAHADVSLRLYWVPKWMTDEDYRRRAADPMSEAGFCLSNGRMEKLLSEVHKRGVADGARASERRGAESFGEAVREEMGRWIGSETREGFHDSVPMWSLEKLLEQWNMPPLASVGTESNTEREASS